MHRFLAILVGLYCLSFEVSPSLTGSRSLLRTIGNGNGGADLPDVAYELNDTNFVDVLRQTPATFAIVEFFAHWCPACRNYKPHYEKVARIFNGPDAAHPGIVLMTRVDCALKINTKLCDRFSVDRYPMLLWGRPSKFTSISKWDGEDGEIEPIKDGRTAERLLDWINKKMSSSYGLDDEKYEHEHLQSNVSDPGQVARAIYDVEEATTSAFDIILRHKMIKAGTRASLIRFLQLLVAHHPSRRCREGGAEILVNFDDLYPSGIVATNEEKGLFEKATSALDSFQICGKELPRGYWMFCRGSRNDTRGFSVSYPFNKTSDFALWLWSAHNKVNERLVKEEALMKTGDPQYPKITWPPKQLCPSCYLSSSKKADASSQIKWDKNAVFKFLVSYYGRTLVSLIKDSDSQIAEKHAHSEEQVGPTNPVVVPIGAALAIAIASCAFGALACLWRSQQKSRKYRHLHSLKNI